MVSKLPRNKKLSAHPLLVVVVPICHKWKHFVSLHLYSYGDPHKGGGALRVAEIPS